jgi:hypothetical protein
MNWPFVWGMSTSGALSNRRVGRSLVSFIASSCWSRRTIACPLQSAPADLCWRSSIHFGEYRIEPAQVGKPGTEGGARHSKIDCTQQPFGTLNACGRGGFEVLSEQPHWVSLANAEPCCECTFALTPPVTVVRRRRYRSPTTRRPGCALPVQSRRDAARPPQTFSSRCR